MGGNAEPEMCASVKKDLVDRVVSLVRYYHVTNHTLHVKVYYGQDLQKD